MLLAYFITKYPTKDLTGLLSESKQDLSVLGNLVVLKFIHLINAYTKAHNKVYQRRGFHFTRSLTRKEITDNTHFTQVIHYIHTDPVHHGFVKKIHDLRWSSFCEIIQKESSLVKREEIINWFCTKEEYLRFPQHPIDVRTKIEMDT